MKTMGPWLIGYVDDVEECDTVDHGERRAADAHDGRTAVSRRIF